MRNSLAKSLHRRALTASSIHGTGYEEVLLYSLLASMKKPVTEKASLEDVLFAINHFSTSVDQRFEGMDQRFNKIDQRFEKIDVELFSIRTHMATKQDILDVRSDLEHIKDETIRSIDGFGVLCQKFDMELLALRSRFMRMEDFMRKVAERLSMQGEIV